MIRQPPSLPTLASHHSTSGTAQQRRAVNGAFRRLYNSANGDRYSLCLSCLARHPSPPTLDRRRTHCRSPLRDWRASNHHKHDRWATLSGRLSSGEGGFAGSAALCDVADAELCCAFIETGRIEGVAIATEVPFGHLSSVCGWMPLRSGVNLYRASVGPLAPDAGRRRHRPRAVPARSCPFRGPASAPACRARQKPRKDRRTGVSVKISKSIRPKA